MLEEIQEIPVLGAQGGGTTQKPENLDETNEMKQASVQPSEL